jgi:hypothetical protein
MTISNCPQCGQARRASDQSQLTAKPWKSYPITSSLLPLYPSFWLHEAHANSLAFCEVVLAMMAECAAPTMSAEPRRDVGLLHQAYGGMELICRTLPMSCAVCSLPIPDMFSCTLTASRPSHVLWVSFKESSLGIGGTSTRARPVTSTQQLPSWFGRPSVGPLTRNAIERLLTLCSIVGSPIEIWLNAEGTELHITGRLGLWPSISKSRKASLKRSSRSSLTSAIEPGLVQPSPRSRSGGKELPLSLPPSKASLHSWAENAPSSDALEMIALCAKRLHMNLNQPWAT